MKDKNAKNLRKSMNRGSIEHETRAAEKEGEIMTLAKKDVMSIPQTKTIKEAVEEANLILLRKNTMTTS